MPNSPADMGIVDARAAGKKSGSVEKLKLSNYLGILVDDPDDFACVPIVKIADQIGPPMPGTNYCNPNHTLSLVA